VGIMCCGLCIRGANARVAQTRILCEARAMHSYGGMTASEVYARVLPAHWYDYVWLEPGDRRVERFGPGGGVMAGELLP